MGEYSFSVSPSDDLLDLKLYQFGWEQCSPLHSFGPFVRNHYLFHYVISGRGYLDANITKESSRIYHLEAGQGFLITPGKSRLTAPIRTSPGNMSGWSSTVCGPRAT